MLKRLMLRSNISHIITLFILLISTGTISAQQFSNDRNKTLIISQDTVSIDSLSIIPGTIELNAKKPNDDYFKIDTLKSLFIVKRPDQFFKDKDTVRIEISYQVFPYNFNKRWESIYTRSEKDYIVKTGKKRRNKEQSELFDFGQIQKSGAISRSFSVGNRQGASLNSNLDLQMNGALTNDISIRAAITDNKIPLEPEGNTKQIQEFDNVFIELQQRNNKLTVGDFELSQNKNRFLKYRQKVQGLKAETELKMGKNKEKAISLSAGAALSKGKYARNKIKGLEGNQGPYKLRGNNNERFIVVLAGSESVFLDGEKLERGENQDYIINYNTAEVTFTPNNIITKDSRIIVEFEYSDRNYARAVFATKANYKTEKLEVDFDYFNNSDLKNQPFGMELNDTSKSILADAGDDPLDARMSGVDSVAFSPDKILYRMTDSLGYDSVLVYSVDSDSAHYQAKFTKVGQNNGNYVKTKTAANGNVYKWVKPVNGIPQGNYSPIEILIAPRKKEVSSLSATYSINKHFRAGFNASASNEDLNLFSDQDTEDNKGFAGEMWIQHSANPNILKDTASANWKTRGSFRIIDQNFQAVNRFRNVEFDRNWNLAGNQKNHEIHSKISSALSEKAIGNVQIKHEYLQRRNTFEGQRYSLNGDIKNNGYFLSFDGSLLQSSGSGLNSRFMRHKGKAGKEFSLITITLDEDYEHNTFWLIQDSITSRSYAYQAYGAEVALTDTNKFQTLIRYETRQDKLPLNGTLKNTSQSDEGALDLQWRPDKRHQLNVRMGYRQLTIQDTISPEAPEKNLNARINYSGSFAKGAIINRTFYQTGSGLEVEKDYTYLEVNPGEGVYQWIDYNNNNVKEKDEFEVAQFQDKANYIRVSTPTDDYFRVYTNQFRQTLKLNPQRIWHNSENSWKKFAAKFNNRFNYRISHKNQYDNFQKSYNPFLSNADNENVITLNKQFKNTFYFQRNNAKFGMHWSFRQNESKNLLSNGSEQQFITENILNIRWNFTSSLSLLTKGNTGTKERRSEFFSNKEYNIQFYKIEPELSYRPSSKIRIKGIFQLTSKENQLSSAAKANIKKYSINIRFANIDKGDLQTTIDYLDIKYPGKAHTNLGYEMLNGFNNGNNFQWNISYQRKVLEYLQMNLQYEGRKLPGAKTNHTGRLQLRAYF
ncbi:MAG: hypothetical protein ACOCPM_00285 [Bacteroidales bacterium]